MQNIEEQTHQKQSVYGKQCRIQICSKGLATKKRRVKTWSTYEDQQLVRLYNQYPKKWATIAKLMNDRNQNQCLHRYRRLCLLGVKQKVWSVHEDQKILDLVKKVGKNWKLVSEVLGTKTGKQIRERYINKLDPQIKTQDWTEEQDQLILKYYSQMGSKWSQISKKIPGRPQNKIKNRFYSYIQKNYNIKFIAIDSNKPQPKNQNAHNLQQRLKKQTQQKQQTLKQVILNQKIKQPFPDKKTKTKQVASLKQLQQQQQQRQQQQMLFQSNNEAQNKYGLHSLIKVDEQFPQIDDNRYRSIKSLNSNNAVQNQNDLFYTLHI